MSQKQAEAPEKVKVSGMWRQYPGVTIQLLITLWAGIGIDPNAHGPQLKIRFVFFTLTISGCDTEKMGYSALIALKTAYQKLTSEYNQMCIMKGTRPGTAARVSKGGIILNP